MEEQRHKEERELGQISTLLESVALVNYDHVELTKEEHDAAIHLAKSRKAAKLNEIAYLEKLNKPKEYIKFTYDTIQEYLFRTYNIVHFHEFEKLAKLKQTRTKHFVLDEHNIAQFEMLCQYFTGDEAFLMNDDDYSLDKGIMLFGPVGCGKTQLMKMFSLNSIKPYKVTPCREIADEYTKTGADCLDKYASLQPCYPQQNFGIPLLGRSFDDLGTEDNKSNFGNKVNVMQDILYKIYERDHIGNFHTTTNITTDEIESFYGVRIRSRLKEMYNIIEFDPNAPDRRR